METKAMRVWIIPLLCLGLFIARCQPTSSPAQHTPAESTLSTPHAAQPETELDETSDALSAPAAQGPLLADGQSGGTPSTSSGATLRLPPHQAQAKSMPATKVSFHRETFHFGKVPEGTVVTHRFRFKNLGEHPFHITKVNPACGCTTPQYSDAAVAPQQEGYIDISFNTRERPGIHTKTVTVTGNFQGEVDRVLKLKGEVEASNAPGIAQQ